MTHSFKTIQEARQWASLFLQQHDREAKIADLLLDYHLQLSYAQLLACLRDAMPEEKQAAFIHDIKHHAVTGIPIQHMTGTGHFFGRTFTVTPDVLIPRPETEELVEGVLAFARSRSWNDVTIADIGTGAGVIAITLALELQGVTVKATDISPQALAVAKQNAASYQAEVTFKEGHFLDALNLQGVDILVSNPPYISYAEEASLSDTVREFDPALALFADHDGLAAYHVMVRQLAAYPREKQPALIAFEMGHLQGDRLAELMLKEVPHYQTEIRKDMNGHPRFIFAVKADDTFSPESFRKHLY
ncbi:peptide chain release factor N(5)-glutamine methyltransferase [Thalassobacillus sp. CUG 92003]|uniref:peptide chain release factor N(5)-glutamine methyltransferase n=1 Tax=Thalassobacillus sp. CUG 92003 TaxID=2736641 RepID=UPI0015E65E12|nr:peptide chain release factor N(5)-glutamine methyltransferase [Thalassobacillus sp. CUG 92003]